MDFAHFWFDQQTAEPFDGIGESLRFRGAQTLNKATGGSGTASVWIKRSRLGTAQTVMGAVAFAANDTLNGSTALFRDPSAWMHVVISTSGTYVNGVSVATGSAVVGGTIGTSFEGYLAEFHYIDGTALDPTSFGVYNADDVWVPKKVSVADYGTNGFYLDFSDPNNIGADRSGKGNNWTPNGFELANTASTNYDWMADSPTQNYATLNSIVKTASTFTDANLKALIPFNVGSIVRGTQGVTSGKWYWESSRSSSIGGVLGLIGINQKATQYYPGHSQLDSIGLSYTGQLYRQGTAVQNYGQMTANDIHGFALDLDNGGLWISRNGTWLGGGDPATNTGASITADLIGYEWTPAGGNNNNAQATQYLNCGNHPFAHTPPAGFKPLQTQELPAVTITNPSDHFDVITDTGANILTAAQAKFPNGLWWIKDRVNSNQNQLVDSVNGTGAVRQSPANSDAAYAAPTGSSVAWCWATPASGINTTAGFSVTAGAHGLGVTPAMVIDRSLNVWHQSLTAGQGLKLNTNETQTAQAWTVNATTVTGPGGGTYFTWAEIPDYSAFGSYTGNGNTDGPFVYTGFKPKFVLLKNIGYTNDWGIFDTQRNVYNPVDSLLKPSRTNAEVADPTFDIDFVSNGFKIRASDQLINYQYTYIYAAFAEHPFGGSNVSPTTAR